MQSASVRSFTCLVLVLALCSVSAGRAQKPGTRPAIAEMAVADAVHWKPAVEYERLILTVSGPFDDLRREFAAGEPVRYAPVDADGKALPDGRYRYELRVVPKLSPEVKKTLEAARQSGDRDAARRKLLVSGRLPRRPVLQSGVFTIEDGKLVPPDPKADEEDENGGSR